MHLQTRKIRLKHEHILKCIEIFSERQNRKKHSVHRGDAFWSNVCKDLGVPNNCTNRKKLNHVALHYQKVSTLWYLCLESEYYSGLSIYQGEWQTFFKLWINYRAKVEWATEVCLDMKNSGWIIKIWPCTGTPKYNKVEGYCFTLQIDENVITTCVLNREPWKSYTNQKISMLKVIVGPPERTHLLWYVFQNKITWFLWCYIYCYEFKSYIFLNCINV